MMTRHNMIPALALCALGLACGEEADTFTDLRGSVQVQGVEVTPATEGDTGDGATGDGADGGTPTTDTTYAGPPMSFTVKCSTDSIGPRETTDGEFRFSSQLDPPDRLPAGNCQLCATEAPQGFTMAALCQSVEVLDSAVTNVVVLVTPVTPHPEEPPHPCDPETDCNGNDLPDVVEPGGSEDPAEPFGTIHVLTYVGTVADTVLTNGVTVTIGSETHTTGEDVCTGEGDARTCEAGVAVFTGLSLVTPHTIVLTPPTGSGLGSLTMPVTFAPGQTEVVQEFVLLPLPTLIWGNATCPPGGPLCRLPPIEVGQTLPISFTLLLDGVPVGYDAVTGCTLEPAEMATTATDCSSLTGLAAGDGVITVHIGEATSSLAFTVVANE